MIDRRSRTIQINRQKSLLLVYEIFVLSVIFEPDYIKLTSFHLVFMLAKYLAAGLVILVFIIRKVKLNGLLIGTSIFEGLLLISTLENNYLNTETWIKECAYIIILMFFGQTVMEQDAGSLPLALSMVLGLYTHINTVCRIMYPHGMYPPTAAYYQYSWFLGYDNCACIIIQLAITVTLFRILYYKEHFLLWDWSVLISGCWFILYQGIATTIIAGAGFFAIVFASRNNSIRKIFAKGTLLVTGMFILFFLIQFATALVSDNFSFAFSALGKNGTFTGRIIIWSAAWREIQNGGWLCWLLGKGQQPVEMYQKHFGGRNWAHLHSYYLQVIYEGGFLAFAVLFGLLIYVTARFDKGKYSHTYIIFLAGFAAIMLMWQVEAYGGLVKYGFIILSLMYNTPLLVKSEKANDKKRVRFRLSKQGINKVF